MARHHYLGDLPKIGKTLWYVATWRGQWLAQLTLSAAALKCGVRDRWIGWDFRSQYDRLNLIASNCRFLILPEGRFANVCSRVLGMLARRIAADWHTTFGHPLLLLETFVDPHRFHGGVYRAANWLELGLTRGFRRTRDGYSSEANAPKRVFVYPVHRHAAAFLTHPDRNMLGLTGAPKMQINAEQMHSLPHYFAAVPDPRRSQGRRHRLPVVLALAAGATLCGMRGYQAMAEWAADLGQVARARFGCRRVRNDNGKIHYEAPSQFVIRDCLVRIDPDAVNAAFAAWQQAWGIQDEPLAIDGKTMKGAINAESRQTHMLSLVGHDSEHCYAQTKSAPCP